jgi:hypothetical protein
VGRAPSSTCRFLSPLAKRAFNSAVASERHAVVTGDSSVGIGLQHSKQLRNHRTDEMMSLRALVEKTPTPIFYAR